MLNNLQKLFIKLLNYFGFLESKYSSCPRKRAGWQCREADCEEGCPKRREP